MTSTVLITGSASGIGRATAELFTARGWNVAATVRDPRTIDPFVGAAPNRKVVQLDVTDDASVARGVAEVLSCFGAIDVLVNNAGYGVFGPLEALSDGDLEAQLATNFLGATRIIRHVLPSMRGRRSGTIINVSSRCGRIAVPFASAYCASKYALEGLSESLRFELAIHGIRIKVVEPGHFRTCFARALVTARHPAYADALRNHMRWVERAHERSPTPEPVAAAIWDAVHDHSDRLRYPVGSRLLLALAAVVPDRLWRRLIGTSMRRLPSP